MRGWVAVIGCLVGACKFTPPTSDPAGAEVDAPAPIGGTDATLAGDAAAPQNFHLRIEVLVDGMSHLIVKGTTLHWQHYVFAAPGRWQLVTEPTKLNGVDWFPTWPDVPDIENRDCNGCVSSTTELPIGVPRAPSTTTLTEVQVRRSQAIVQAPAVENDYELIAEITDQGVGNGAQYIVELDVVIN